MALVGPPPLLKAKPLAVLKEDLRDERGATVPFPPGQTRVSLTRTRRFAADPLPMLLDGYERYGPVFTLRLFHSNVVFMPGPEANHYMLVSHASNFLWREGHFRDLIGLMGDGLLTIDGDFHRRSRRIMLPTFHHDHILASVDVIVEETTRALESISPGAEFDLYKWTRRLAMRVAMRALFGVDPDGERARSIDAAGLFERALSFYASEYILRIFRGPWSPWARMQATARKLDELIYPEIAARRSPGRRGRDVPRLVLDETLRKYPPAWVGPRRAIEPFEFAGHHVPGRAFVNYCSWASHHLPDVFPEPEEFRPERFAPEAKATLAKGAYVPFGGGSRTCIGMRFGQLEVRTIAALALARFTLRLPADFTLQIRQMPTISPKHGLPIGMQPRQGGAASAPAAEAGLTAAGR